MSTLTIQPVVYEGKRLSEIGDRFGMFKNWKRSAQEIKNEARKGWG